ncbi:MAG: hypothetical protein IKD18_01745 [Clostridia bacterium]|nr:hypothetical protein [Clostridia bacterium]
MYFLIILVGLLCVILSFHLLNIEGTTRRKRYHKKLGHRAILVHTGKVGEDGREIVNRYPVVSARLSFGRKPRISPLRVDIPGPVEDKTLSHYAATFYYNDYGEFCIHRSCKKIWVCNADATDITVLKDGGAMESEEIPELFRIPGYSSSYREYDRDIRLEVGDHLLIGNTHLEYVEVNYA